MPANGKLVAFGKLVVCVLMLVTFLASCVGLVTNYWIDHGNTHHQGLWYFCNDEDIGCLHFDQDLNIPKVPGIITFVATIELEPPSNPHRRNPGNEIVRGDNIRSPQKSFFQPV